MSHKKEQQDLIIIHLNPPNQPPNQQQTFTTKSCECTGDGIYEYIGRDSDVEKTHPNHTWKCTLCGHDFYSM